jgi:transcriptional regulator with XRE-family HTH domain
MLKPVSLTLSAMETLGERVRRLRLALGLNQKQCVEGIPGLGASALSQIEQGQVKNVRPDNLIGLAKKLRVTAEELVTGKAPPKHPGLPENAVVFNGEVTEVPRAAARLLERYTHLSEDAQDNLRGYVERLWDAEEDAGKRPRPKKL